MPEHVEGKMLRMRLIVLLYMVVNIQYNNLRQIIIILCYNYPVHCSGL